MSFNDPTPGLIQMPEGIPDYAAMEFQLAVLHARPLSGPPVRLCRDIGIASADALDPAAVLTYTCDRPVHDGDDSWHVAGSSDFMLAVWPAT